MKKLKKFEKWKNVIFIFQKTDFLIIDSVHGLEIVF